MSKRTVGRLNSFAFLLPQSDLIDDSGGKYGRCPFSNLIRSHLRMRASGKVGDDLSRGGGK